MSLKIQALWTVVHLEGAYKYFFFLWLCSPAQAMASCRRLWPPRPRGFLITQNDALQSVGLLWTSDQLVAETST
jgi:hypothetical protein